MSEEPTNNGTPNTDAPNNGAPNNGAPNNGSTDPAQIAAQKAADAVNAIRNYSQKANRLAGKGDSMFEKLYGYIDRQPWFERLEKTNAFVGICVSPCILAAGVAALAAALLCWIQSDSDFYSFGMFVKSGIGVAIAAVLSSHLAPKALALQQSCLSKSELDYIRPEFMYILKTVLGVGSLLGGIVLLFSKEILASVSLFGIGVIAVILLGCPKLIGCAPGYPKNTVEEIISIFRMLIKSVLVFATLATGIATLGGLGYGLWQFFSDLKFPAGSIFVFLSAVVAPLAIPLAVYFFYLAVMFTLDGYRAVVSIPAKLDALKEALSK